MILTPDQYHTIRPGDIVTKTYTFRGVRESKTINVSKITDLALMGYYGLVNEEGYIMVLNLDETEYADVEVTLERPTLLPPTAPFIIAYEFYGEATTTNGEGWNMVQKRNGHYVILFKGTLGPREYLPEELTQYDVAEFAPVTP